MEGQPVGRSGNNSNSSMLWKPAGGGRVGNFIRCVHFSKKNPGTIISNVNFHFTYTALYLKEKLESCSVLLPCFLRETHLTFS